MASPLFARKPLSLLLEEAKGENRLRRVLGPVQLTSLGVGAIIGTGIFVLTGVAAHDKAGPALTLSFVVSGLACVFAALCYAEFASMTPVAGSAYTYAYATLGELFAWIIGWDLILEYAVASAAVSQGWSAYFQDFMHALGLHWPRVWGLAPFDFDPAAGFMMTGTFLNLPAVLIAAAVTWVLVIGIRESAGFNTVIVVIKLVIVLFVIVVGAFYVNPANWHPFAPYGYSGLSFFGRPILGQTSPTGAPVGVLAGAAIIFFAYIGFDSISTHAEEAKRPNRDVPIAIIASLVLCTVLYIAVAAVLTGMIPYDKIDIKAPVSDAFAQVGLPWAQVLVSIGAVAGITSVLLVMMLSQPRILLAMARDGLVPTSFFGAVHDEVPDSLEVHSPHRGFRDDRGSLPADPRAGRADQHRHALRLRRRLLRRPDHAVDPSRGRAPVPRAARAAGADRGDPDLPDAHVLPRARELVPPHRLAPAGAGDLLQLRSQAQRHGPAARRREGVAG